ncbi:hypothetical protein DRI50_03335 [candidate division KSB1 bacterium]|nr:MAG: hypothetical protein DRI50_03335 [candidate division KSB1 bacterium]
MSEFKNNCPHCDHPIEVEISTSGMEYECPNCSNKIVLPDPSEIISHTKENGQHAERICPYCRTAIDDPDEIKFCSACHTPHHVDCWDENNGCTVFGCSMAPPDEEKVDVAPEDVGESVPPLSTAGQKINAPGAVASIVWGAVGFFFWWGLVFGLIAIFQAIKAKKLIEAQPEAYKGSGLTNIGYALGIITLAIWNIMLLAATINVAVKILIFISIFLFFIFILRNQKNNEHSIGWLKKIISSNSLISINRFKSELSCIVIRKLLGNGELSKALDGIKVLINNNAYQEAIKMLDIAIFRLRTSSDEINQAFSFYNTDHKSRNEILSLISDLEKIKEKLANRDTLSIIESEDFRSKTTELFQKIQSDYIRMESLLKESKDFHFVLDELIIFIRQNQYVELPTSLRKIKRFKISRSLLKEFVKNLEDLYHEKILPADELIKKGHKELDNKNLQSAITLFSQANNLLEDYLPAKSGLETAKKSLEQARYFLSKSKKSYDLGSYSGYRSAIKNARSVISLDNTLSLEADHIISEASENLRNLNKTIRKKVLIYTVLVSLSCFVLSIAYTKYEKQRIEKEFNNIMIKVEKSDDYQESIEILRQFITEELRDPYASILDDRHGVPFNKRFFKFFYDRNKEQFQNIKTQAEEKIRSLNVKIEVANYKKILELAENAVSLENSIEIIENNISSFEIENLIKKLNDKIFLYKTKIVKRMIENSKLETAKYELSKMLIYYTDEDKYSILRTKYDDVEILIDDRDFLIANEVSLDYPNKKKYLCNSYLASHPMGRHRIEATEMIEAIIGHVYQNFLKQKEKLIVEKDWEEGISLCVEYLELFDLKDYKEEIIKFKNYCQTAIENEFDERDFNKIGQTADYYRKISLCEEYLRKRPHGNFRENVMLIIKKTQLKYFNDYKEKKQKYIKTKDWRAGLSLCEEVQETQLILNSPLINDVNEFQKYCQKAVKKGEDDWYNIVYVMNIKGVYNSYVIELLEDYINRHPNGAFAGNARKKLQNLKNK